METKYCQSCGMPLQKQEELGSNRDGSKNEEFCCYCYKDGAFTQDCTLEQMIEHCAQFVAEFNRRGHCQHENLFPDLKALVRTIEYDAIH